MLAPVVACTAHRWFPGEQAQWVQRKVWQSVCWLRDNWGMRVGICGMAFGGDLWFAQAVLDAGLELHAHVPFPQQSDAWSLPDRQRYQRLLGSAAQVKTYGQVYDRRLYHARNDGMLQAADALLAIKRSVVHDGGTNSTVIKADDLRMPIFHLDPDAMTETVRHVDERQGELFPKSEVQ